MAPDLLSRLQAKQIVVEGITSNSRNVKKNYIFFAIKGSKNDGNKYIKDILKKKTICNNYVKEKYLFDKYSNNNCKRCKKRICINSLSFL